MTKLNRNSLVLSNVSVNGVKNVVVTGSDRLGSRLANPRTPALQSHRWLPMRGYAPADPIAGNSWDRYSRASYGLVYARTALVFHDLEQRLGGDLLARGFQEYYRRWHHRHPSTADLEKTLADVAGERAPVVHRWFAEQVYDRAPIDDRVVLVEAQEILLPLGFVELPDGKRVERDAKEVEKLVREAREAFRKAHPDAKPSQPGPFPWRSTVEVRRYAAQVPQKLLVKFEDGSSETIVWPEEERWHRYVFERPVKIESAQLDPERNWLLDLDKLDDGRTREKSALAGRRWTLEFSIGARCAMRCSGGSCFSGGPPCFFRASSPPIRSGIT